MGSIKYVIVFEERGAYIGDSLFSWFFSKKNGRGMKL
jgi:hypothetical protein